MRLLFASTAALLVNCGGSIPVKAVSADPTTVARHRTYAHDVTAPPPEGHAPSSRSPVVIEKARANVDAELKSRGYVLATPAEAEMIVRVTSGTRNVADHPTGAAAAAGAHADIDTESKLVVDIVARTTNEPLFHGTATKTIHTDKVDDTEVATAVKEMFEKLPPRSATP